MAQTHRRCCLCEFWLMESRASDIGTCKAHPPTPLGGRTVQALPQMHGDDWCGEFSMEDRCGADT